MIFWTVFKTIFKYVIAVLKLFDVNVDWNSD